MKKILSLLFAALFSAVMFANVTGTLTLTKPVLSTGLTSSNTRGGVILKSDGLYFCNYADGVLTKMDREVSSVTTVLPAIGKGYYMDQDVAGNIVVWEWKAGGNAAKAQVYAPDLSPIRNDVLDFNARCDIPAVVGNLVTGKGAYLVVGNSKNVAWRYNFVNGVFTTVDEISLPITTGSSCNTIAPVDMDHFFLQSRGNGLLFIDLSGATPVVTQVNPTLFGVSGYTSTHGGKAFKVGDRTFYAMGTYKDGGYLGGFAVYDVTDPATAYQVAADNSSMGSTAMGTSCATFQIEVEDNVAHLYEFACYAIRKYDLTMDVVNFHATTPAGTRNCYVTGSFNTWGGFQEMEKVADDEFAYSYWGTAATKANVEYKYCAGPDWGYVEKTSEGAEMANRTWAANDVVARWAARPITVHFAFTGESPWATTYAHVWNTANPGSPKHAYPGETAAANASHAGWVDFDVPYPTYNSILFNNGGSGEGNQTADITIDGTAEEVFVASNAFATASKVIVHTNADGYATYYGDVRADVPAGITNVYTATYTSGTYVTLNDEADFIAKGIPAHTGVILKGEADTDYEFAYDWLAAGASDNVNSLSGTVAAYSRNLSKVTYVLSRQNDVTALYKYEGTMLPANKACLELNAEAAAPVIRIIGEATNIQNLEGQQKTIKFIENGRVLIMKDGITYDVMGRIVR